MTETIIMPKLGFDMAEGTLVRWLIGIGETVKKGSVLAEIETDKATVEVESSFEGIMARHLVEEGAVVPVNTPIAFLVAPGEQIEEPILPALKISPSKEPKVIDEIKGVSEEKVKESATIQSVAGIPAGVRASPIARRMASDLRINLSSVVGSGPEGRVTKRDILRYLGTPTSNIDAEVTSVVPVIELVEPSDKSLSTVTGEVGFQTAIDKIEPINRLRSAIGRRMAKAKQQIPHFYVTHEYDVQALMEMRKQINCLLSEDQKVSVNDFIVKSVALALRQFPNLNAALQGDQVITKGAINIGVAVAVENGLLTVVVHDADMKTLSQISREVKIMAERARQGKVRTDDIEGSTFSVSNLGMFDVEHFIAIINPPEAAILALGSARETPIVKAGQLAVGWRMKATISVDHRISDGAEAARFMQLLTSFIEEPLQLLI